MNTSRRLTMLQVTQLCGQPIGPLRRDPTFPMMSCGSFDEAAVLAWKSAQDAKLPQGESK